YSAAVGEAVRNRSDRRRSNSALSNSAPVNATRIVETAAIVGSILSYTHDLIRSKAALDNLLGQARRGCRVAATSTKLYAPWLFPANWYLRITHRAYITNFESFATPWSLLAEYLEDFRVETGPTTQHYVATGKVR
ncbi:MAG TPA: hypothetical protein VLJ84_15005, partial [Usitatibacter sp.]|nr:hypothetical protein [Usitatibacter sp.]